MAGPRPSPPKPAPVKPFAMGRPNAVLLITGGTHGRLETCDCLKPVPGGLGRRSGLFASYRAAFGNVTTLDTGDFFWIDADGIRNRYVLDGYRLAGYDVLCAGDHELMARRTLLPAELRQNGLRLLATNLDGISSWPAGGGRLLESAAIARGGALAIVSYLGPGTLAFVPEAQRDLKLAGVDRLARMIQDLRRQGRAVVLVAHAEQDELGPLAPLGADLIVQAHTTRSDADVLKLGSTPMVRVGGGDQVGVLALRLGRGRIAQMEFRLEPIITDWPEDARLIELYQAFGREYQLEALEQRTGLAVKYESPAACGRCHERQARTWRQGPHARATAPLARVGRQDDATCLPCHTGGFGRPGGFDPAAIGRASAAKSATSTALAAPSGVTCQDCHRLNLIQGEHARGRGRPEEEACRLCHTPRTSPGFDFAAWRRLAAH